MENENMNDWLLEENERLKTEGRNFEERESLNFEEDQTTEFEIEWSKGPFPTWEDPTDPDMKKKILQVISGGQKMNLWLNVKNPLYAQLIKKGALGQAKFRVKQTGSQKKTRYEILEA